MALPFAIFIVPGWDSLNGVVKAKPFHDLNRFYFAIASSELCHEKISPHHSSPLDPKMKLGKDKKMTIATYHHCLVKQFVMAQG